MLFLRERLGTKNILAKIFFSKHHLETHDICSFMNKIYCNKRMAPINKWLFLTLLKFFYTSSYSLVSLLYHNVWHNRLLYITLVNKLRAENLNTKMNKSIWLEDLHMSLIYKIKNTGPNTEPSGTPNTKYEIEELQYLIETCYFLLLK